MSKGWGIVIFGLLFFLLNFLLPINVLAAYRFAQFKAHPPVHIFGSAQKAPGGMSPQEIKKIYHLPTSGGHGTVAIIGAYDDAVIEKDLNVFSSQFGLPECTTKNGCFKKHNLGAIKSDSGWNLETSLDVEWAHAIAPQAKILLVEAKTPSGQNLLDAIDYAVKQNDVIAVSMSWGGGEFAEETKLDDHFNGKNKISFFASSGDNGTGASWPAASPKVVAVGGTTILFNGDRSLKKELAWDGSGGGVSAFEKQPDYQKSYTIKKSNGYRAIPDVAYDADPASGFSVYKTTGKNKNNWYVLGGTSAGAPQWAAIQALGLSATNNNFYVDKASNKNGNYFTDIISGKNGDCGYLCAARKHYDYVTGLGSPLTVNF